MSFKSVTIQEFSTDFFLPPFLILLPTIVLLSPLSLLQATESELGDVDLSGLPEAAVDSEEEEEEDEDLERASDTLLGRDLVRECLEKDPADRNDDDIGQSNSSVFLSRMPLHSL